jgi:predicted  nucleic acid-binding Zn-ribbon protein
MTEPDSLVLRYLRQIDEKLDLLRADVHDLKVRMSHVEEGIGGINRRIDRLDQRMDRIEKRMGLVDAP